MLKRIIKKVNNTLTSDTSLPTMTAAQSKQTLTTMTSWGVGSVRAWSVLAAAAFLVSVPVFFQAPLVRVFPWASLLMTGGWLLASGWLLSQPSKRLWGDILFGFSLSWLAGSLYWGWLRGEPLLHLPIEAMGLPLVFWSLRHNWYKVGNFFYLGSLLGTAVTDLYFYLVDLIPYWRQLMQVDPGVANLVLQEAKLQVQTGWGLGWAVALVVALLMAGLLPLTLQSVREARIQSLHWWAFSGAILSTLLVDGLFWALAAGL
jgi:hypothetical protein